MDICGCALCNEILTGELVLKRFLNFSVVFNRYPYIPGHIMVISNSHVSSNLNNFTPRLRSELMEISLWAQNLLLQTTGYDSANIGMNLGSNSGGSIPEHFHIHIVPRKINDTNFMAVITNGSTYPKYQQIEFNQRIRNSFAWTN